MYIIVLDILLTQVTIGSFINCSIIACCTTHVLTVSVSGAFNSAIQTDD